MKIQPLGIKYIITVCINFARNPNILLHSELHNIKVQFCSLFNKSLHRFTFSNLEKLLLQIVQDLLINTSSETWWVFLYRVNSAKFDKYGGGWLGRCFSWLRTRGHSPCSDAAVFKFKCFTAILSGQLFLVLDKKWQCQVYLDLVFICKKPFCFPRWFRRVYVTFVCVCTVVACL